MAVISSASQVTGEGPIVLSDKLTLDTVRIVPSLAYNLKYFKNFKEC